MLDEWAKYQLKLNRIPEEDVDEVSTDMVVKFKDGSERRICEIFSRCMGYLRRTADFNVGKYSEYESRKEFTEEKALKHLDDGDPDDIA